MLMNPFFIANAPALTAVAPLFEPLSWSFEFFLFKSAS
jgi:hypothetical protein